MENTITNNPITESRVRQIVRTSVYNEMRNVRERQEFDELVRQQELKRRGITPTDNNAEFQKINNIIGGLQEDMAKAKRQIIELQELNKNISKDVLKELEKAFKKSKGKNSFSIR
jgi:septal ring factor EnvC (AmiA/AmiB activator)